MTARSFKLFTRDILDSIEKIEEFTGGMDYDEFLRDDKTSSAVIRKLEIIGEAVKQLPFEVRGIYGEIPWKEMAGMRDKLIHWYFGVDYEMVWKVVTEELPILKPLLVKVFDIIQSTDIDLTIPDEEADQQTETNTAVGEEDDVDSENGD